MQALRQGTSRTLARIAELMGERQGRRDCSGSAMALHPTLFLRLEAVNILLATRPARTQPEDGLAALRIQRRAPEDLDPGAERCLEQIGVTTPAGRLQLHILSAISQFERERVRGRVIAGLQRARKQGTRLGRPRKVATTIAIPGDSVRPQLGLGACRNQRPHVGSRRADRWFHQSGGASSCVGALGLVILPREWAGRQALRCRPRCQLIDYLAALSAQGAAVVGRRTVK